MTTTEHGRGDGTARARRRRTARLVTGALGVAALAALSVLLLRAVGPAAVAVLLAMVAAVAAVAGLLLAADHRRRAATAPVDLALRRTPPLDAERVREAARTHGPVGAVREVRRQAPWLSLAEAVALAEQVA